MLEYDKQKKMKKSKSKNEKKSDLQSDVMKTMSNFLRSELFTPIK